MIAQGAEAKVYYSDGNTSVVKERTSIYSTWQNTLDADGKEWWNSRKLARVMGYSKYWNFERVIAKAQAWATQVLKPMHSEMQRKACLSFAFLSFLCNFAKPYLI